MSNPPTVSRKSPRVKTDGSHVQHGPISALSSASPGTSPIEGESSRGVSLHNVDHIHPHPAPYPAPRIKAKTRFAYQSPLLSERESIFATHYLPAEDNDGKAAQLLTVKGAGSDDNSQQRQQQQRQRQQQSDPTMECSFPISPPPSPTSLQNRPSSGKPRSSSVGGLARLPYLAHIAIQNSILSEGMTTNTTHLSHEMTSDGLGKQQAIPLRLAGPSDCPSGRHPTRSAGTEILDSEPSRRPADIDDGEDKSDGLSEDGFVRRETLRLASHKERSASRGKSHVDKSIEATLPNREPAKNVRTRKSSHLMGIFKDNTASEVKRQDGQARQTQAKGDEERHLGGEEDTRLLQRPFPSTPSRSSSRLKAGMPNDSGQDAAPDSKSRKGHAIEKSPENGWPASSALSDTSNGVVSNSPTPSKTDHDPYFRRRDEIKQSVSGMRPILPAKLLAEIREHHNLSPTVDRPAPGTPNTLPSSRTMDSDPFENTKEHPNKQETENDDEDEEHISSAVYFPHPGPSDDEVEQFTSPYEGNKAALSPALPIPLGPIRRSHVTRTTSQKSLPEHIDISVRSKHEKSMFHGNYRPATDEVTDDAHDGGVESDTERSSSGLVTDSSSSASEQELSSEEEASDLSQADPELTPTSTPLPPSLWHRRKQTSTPTPPKGAVVLEPYSHQVGGHSTMFRFSRRAICKQLNNRENEFYERIEQRHPDMLRFLPRYIGVLNVTFSKGPKPNRSAANGEKQGSENDPNRELLKKESEQASGQKGRNQHLAAPTRDVTVDSPRIVSQSQQIGEIPRVILEQNRHIVPITLFGSPERPRSADPHHAHIKGSLSPLPMSRPLVGDEMEGMTAATERSWPDAGPGKHSTCWGTTTVNSKLREQVLREVFGPPATHHQKLNEKGRNTLPRMRGSHHKAHLSDIKHGDLRREMVGVQADQWQVLDPGIRSSGSVPFDDSGPHREEGVEGDASLSPASQGRDPIGRLKKVRSALDAKEQQSARIGNGSVLREGSAIRVPRRGNSAHENLTSRPDCFEHPAFLDEQDGEPDTAKPGMRRTEIKSMPEHARLPNVENLESSSSMPSATKRENAADLVEKGAENNENNGIELAVFGDEHLPLNPKEAQTQSPDQRVVYFLLLEDLTADMGRPCVLDLKMGTRQYGVDADKKKKESQRRKCQTTTSGQLGVRICGMQTWDVKKQQLSYEDKYYGRDVQVGREFRAALTRFLYDGLSYSSVSSHIPTILEKLTKLENMVRRLPSYRFYASSLLMLYDAEPHKSPKAMEEARRLKKTEAEPESTKDGGGGGGQRRRSIELKIVDFANCVAGEDEMPTQAPCPPRHAQDIDRGYVRGLRTLRMYFQRILDDINREKYVERGDCEGMAVGVVDEKPGGSSSEKGIGHDDVGEVST